MKGRQNIMKKTLSIVLAVMMLFALMIPSFASIYNPEDPDAGLVTDNEAIIKTSETRTDGTDGRSWSVTYPAETTFAWNTLVDDAKITYTAKAHLAYNETLTVKVAPSAESKMVHEADAKYALAYTLANAEDTVIGPVGETSKTFNVDIPQAQWDAAPVGAYSDTLTFIATVA